MISNIEIKNIKGIENKSFNVQIVPNKPNLLIAANGFGKSSIATAFLSMNSRRIILADKDCHKGDSSLSPELGITINEQKLVVNASKNELHKLFDIVVINSRLLPKAKKGFKGSVTSNIEIQPINICKIPEKSDFGYKLKNIKEKFGTNNNILTDISYLFKNQNFINSLQKINLINFSKKQTKKALEVILDKINQQKGNTLNIKNWIRDNCLMDFEKIEVIAQLKQHISNINQHNSEIENFLAAYQIVILYNFNPENFEKAMEWSKYLLIKQHYNKLLNDFRTSNWQWAEVKEDKKKGQLFIDFPKAHQLSNGQRDIITLVVNLHKTLYKESTKDLILIIDEVFDYLDDANLVAFQYYVTSIIQAYKDKGNIIYPIILTHLDPGVFFDFCFNKHRIKISYLLPQPLAKAKNTLNLIEIRDTTGNDKLKCDLEKFWFHYNPNVKIIDEDDWPRTLEKDWCSSEDFYKYVTNELTRYLDGKNYDPLAICFALRIKIEKFAFSLLTTEEQKREFLDIQRNTKNKINFVASFCNEIPETHFLLGLIYNTNLHWNPGRDYISPLKMRLEHATIKKLISSIS